MRQDSAAPPGTAGPLSPSPPPAGEEGTPFRSVGFALSGLGFAVASGFRERLAPLSLEPRDFALLRAVGADEGRSQQVVGEQLGVPPSRMVGLVDSLEGRNLIERRPHPNDRRARALHLTAAGQARLEEAAVVAVAFEAEVCGNLAAGERERLLELLAAVTAALGLRPGVHAANAAGAPPDV